MSYSSAVKSEAIRLRKSGYSIKEVAEKLRIAKSTSSVWLSNIKLNKLAQERLKKRKILGQYKSTQIAKEKRTRLIESYNNNAKGIISKIDVDKNLYLLLGSIMFWAEGGKNLSVLSFTNSDSNMVNLFLKCLRSSLQLDERKFRIKIHVHEYHNEAKILKYWSEVTKIPLSQFSRSYLKPNTRKRKRENYMGCANIRYYDYKVALELSSIYNMFAKNF
jgi:hypothetical protein